MAKDVAAKADEVPEVQPLESIIIDMTRPRILDAVVSITVAALGAGRLQADGAVQFMTDLAAVASNILGDGEEEAPAPAEEVEKPTASQIRKSITPDHLISFIDGQKYKTLKRHLTKHGLTIEGYRERYGLPTDYPSVSSNYSAQRSQLAKTLGLGQRGGEEPAAA